MRLGNNLRGIKKMNDDDRQEGIFDAPAKHAEPPAKVCGCGYPPHVGRCQPNTGTESEESTITSLAVIETTSASLVYAPGALTALVDKLKQEVRAQLATLDVSIPKDRARMISLSARVATAKVKLDKLGDSLIEEHRAVVTAVNSDRKAMRDDLDAFKVEVRKPVTDLENAETARKAAHEAALAEIELSGPHSLQNWMEFSAEAMRERIREIESDPRDWQEFSTRAERTKAWAKEQILRAIKAKEEHEAAKIELDRLRAEAAERAIKEREEAAAKAAQDAAERRAAEQVRIAREAAERERQRIENDRIEAEARAKQAEAERVAAEERAARELKEAEERRIREAEQAEARAKQAEAERVAAEERAARELKEAEERAEEERFRAEERAKIALAEAEARERRIAEAAESARLAVIERAKIEAEHAETRRINEAKQAEARRIAEAEAAELAASAAAAKAERERYAAVEAERQRVAARKQAELDEDEKRAKNRAHQGAIHREIVEALAKLGLPEDGAKRIIEAIVQGRVPHVTIEY